MQTTLHPHSDHSDLSNSAFRDTPSPLAYWRSLPTELADLVREATSQSEVLHGLVAKIFAHEGSKSVFYFGRDQSDQLNIFWQNQEVERSALESKLRVALSAGQAACRSMQIETRLLMAPAGIVFAVPLPRPQELPHCLCFFFARERSEDELLLKLALFVSSWHQWEGVQRERWVESEAETAAALVELAQRVNAAESLSEAGAVVIEAVRNRVPCREVALGKCSSTAKGSRLMSLSSVRQFDPHSPFVRGIEALMDETLTWGRPVFWSRQTEGASAASLAHQVFSERHSVPVIYSLPLEIAGGEFFGVLVILADAHLDSVSVRWLDALQKPLAAALQAARRAERSRLRRFLGKCTRLWQTRSGQVLLALAIATVAALFVPIPYRVHCQTVIEPVTRRYVPAPFEGVLEKALAKPGQLVQAGDLLARMDGSELRWRRASLAADQNQAIKKRDTAQATHSYAEQQIAQLEISRLDLELQLLDHRIDNLEIRAPVAGIVVTGDWDRAEGMPLTTGKNLFEIAPLDKMVFEVAVADEEVTHVRLGDVLNVNLDAYPSETWCTTVGRLHPRAEIRDEANVFVVEGEIENREGTLRPGMKGRATVVTGSRSLGWILFHRPWNYLTRKLAW